MRVLDISVDLGAGASPAQLESVVRGIRVAVDVGREAELSRIRRTAAEQMKFPTDEELGGFSDQEFRDDNGPSYRAGQLLEARRQLARLPPGYWWDYWYDEPPRPSERLSFLRGTGYERLLYSAAPWPTVLSTGLDVIDPELYQALVAERVSDLTPDEVVLRRLSYRNPVTAGMVGAGVKVGTEALDKTAGVIETTATLRSRMRITRADADVAQATVDDRIEESRLDVELLREKLREARLNSDIKTEQKLQEQLRTELLMQEVEKGDIQIARERAALDVVQKQQILYDRFIAAGRLDEADAIKALPPGDANALVDLGLRGPELAWVDEEDTEPEDEEDTAVADHDAGQRHTAETQERLRRKAPKLRFKPDEPAS